MSKITCSVIEDMLPLYKEELLSEDSKVLVEEHLKECSKCQAYLKDLNSTINSTEDSSKGLGTILGSSTNNSEGLLEESDKAPLLAIRRKLEYKKLLTIACSVVIAIIFMLAVYVHLTTPILLPYSENLITINKLDNGALMATLSPEVAGYEIDSFTDGRSESNEDPYYHITLWTTLLREYFPKDVGESFIINRPGEKGYTPVRGIFYQGPETEGVSYGAQVIYGSGLPDGGGMAVLPRLALNYYFLLALILTVIGSVITLILRKHPKGKNIALRVTLIPAAYIIGSLLVTGTSGTTHTMLKDFTSILLLMFPIYFLMLLALKLVEYRKYKG
ncbi:MAG: zf-HC2 domain-containing protein [Clostridiaceae bacterium]